MCGGRSTQLSASGARGHVVQIVDPAEETFPYWGRIEFVEPEGGGRITAGRAQTWRADYEARVWRHRDEIRSETDRLSWTFTIHRTDRPASELLLALHSRIGGVLPAGGARPHAAAAPEVTGMIGGLPLGFAEPLVLIGLLTLPVLWLLLRLIPPRPRRIDFPPTRLLLEIAPKEETPARTPWWLTLMRLVLAGLVIIGAAGPLWNPPLTTMTTRAPIAILIDDGWAAAAAWDARLRTAEDIIARAESDRRAVALVPLSEGTRDISFAAAGSARVRLQLIKPKPHTVDRTEALPAIARFLAGTREVELVWLSDAVDLGRGADFVNALAPMLEARAMTIVAGGIAGARALTAADNAAGALSVKVLRSASGTAETGAVRALDLKGLPLGEAPFVFKPEDRETEARFDLPVEIRNDIARIEIGGERSAGAVQLLDKRWRRRSVGIVSGATADTAQPLLSSSYYIGRALGPFADVRLAQGELPAEAVTHFLDQHLPMLILADVGNVAGEAHDRLAHWIEDGGVLVRFAGPRLAASDDDLVPVRLRRGGRILGGSLSWDKPQPLAAFSRESAFNGMAVPTDVTVSRQVLAEPDAALTENTWATLADGTPLVTAARRGKGLIVLFHVTGDTRWSDLPLSGTFVEMLRRIVALAGTNAVTESSDQKTATVHEAVAPSRVLDGFGSFVAPSATARPVPADYSSSATADHPPGFYGPPENLLAVNTLSAGERLTPLDFSALVARKLGNLPQERAAGFARANPSRRARSFPARHAYCSLSRRRRRPAGAALFARKRRGRVCPIRAVAEFAARPRGGFVRRPALGPGDQAGLCRDRRPRR